MKSSRQNKIVEIIRKYHVETQEELADYLQKAGFAVTQATVSRDIRELKLTKVPTESGRSKYAIHQGATSALNDKLVRVLRDAYISMDKAQNILVIKTVQGMAMAVAAALDNMNIQGFMGCIAGDDTIFCVARSNAFCKEIIADIKKVASDDMLEG